MQNYYRLDIIASSRFLKEKSQKTCKYMLTMAAPSTTASHESLPLLISFASRADVSHLMSLSLCLSLLLHALISLALYLFPSFASPLSLLPSPSSLFSLIISSRCLSVLSRQNLSRRDELLIRVLKFEKIKS